MKTSYTYLINQVEKLTFHLKDLIEQIDQFPEVRKGINTKYAEDAILEAEITININKEDKSE